LHVDTGFAEQPKMLFPTLWVNEMEGLISLFEAVLDERPKHTMLLIDAVEERTDVSRPKQTVWRVPNGQLLGGVALQVRLPPSWGTQCTQCPRSGS
jgi:hypothetical protein